MVSEGVPNPTFHQEKCFEGGKLGAKETMVNDIESLAGVQEVDVNVFSIIHKVSDCVQSVQEISKM